MKLWILSDLHLEVERLEASLAVPAGVDVCVVAGDVTNSVAKGIRWLSENVQLPVVYVAGNHEFYRNSIVEGLLEGKAEAKRHPSVHFLDDDLAVIGGVRFVGATLWTDFELMGQQPLAMEHARRAMNDYRAISWASNPWERFVPKHAYEMHVKSRRFLHDALRIPHEGPTVVVTHHCPHPGSVHPKYRGDLLNAAFCSDLSDLMSPGKPDLWVHGHTHESFDYEAEGVRVVCNPRGYGRENAAFNAGLVVDTESLPHFAETEAGHD